MKYRNTVCAMRMIIAPNSLARKGGGGKKRGEVKGV